MSGTNTIITIGRQFGSAGREIGQHLAENLGIPLYDKEILARAAKESGMSKEIFETHDEKPTGSFLYSLVMDTYSMGFAGSTYNDMPINHKIFLVQLDTIKKIASDGPCIIVGRCADYALESYPNVLNVFIYADMDAKIRRISRIYDLTDKKAKELIVKTDKKRSSYYNYFTNKRWGDAAGYDLCINSSKFGVEGAVRLIKEALETENKSAHI